MGFFLEADGILLSLCSFRALFCGSDFLGCKVGLEILVFPDLFGLLNEQYE